MITSTRREPCSDDSGTYAETSLPLSEAVAPSLNEKFHLWTGWRLPPNIRPPGAF